MRTTLFHLARSWLIILTAAGGLVACETPGQGPMTWLDRPLDGEQFALAPIIIQAHGSAAGDIRGFEFFVNEELISSPGASGGQFRQATIEWLPPAPGTYLVRARAIAGGGNPGTEALAIIVIGEVTPTPPVTQPQAVCTPPKCSSDEVLYCPGDCLGSCGAQCATPTPVCPGLPVISSFSANPITITAGQTSTLTWGPITNADSALIDHGVGGPDLSGSMFPVSPMSTTTYVLSATGCGGTVTQSVTVTVLPTKPASVCPGPPVISSFTANPMSITAGQTSTLTWGPITNADSALIDHGVGGPDLGGSMFPVSPTGTTTYVLSATGCGGKVTRSVTITVSPPPVVPIKPVCPGPPVIASFSANPSTITAGQSTTLSWGAVTNATSASIDPGIGGVGTPGSQNVSPGGTTTYTLTASGCGGSVQRQVTVTVNPASQPPPQQPQPPVVVPIVPIAPVLPLLDKTPPSISGVSASPTMLDRKDCGSKTRSVVTARVTDAGGVNRVVARFSGGEVGMGAAGGDTFRGEIGPFSATGQVTIQVVAWDKAGNSAQAGGPTVSIVCIR